MKSKRTDRITGLLFAIATIAVIAVFFTNKDFFEWAFARHQNTLSWYIRPLFIIPIVIGAYRKSYAVIFISIFSLFTSMFWFPQPAAPDRRVIGFLNFEKGYLTSGWTADKIFVVIAIILFFLFIICLNMAKKVEIITVGCYRRRCIKSYSQCYFRRRRWAFNHQTGAGRLDCLHSGNCISDNQKKEAVNLGMLRICNFD